MESVEIALECGLKVRMGCRAVADLENFGGGDNKNFKHKT